MKKGNHENKILYGVFKLPPDYKPTQGRMITDPRELKELDEMITEAKVLNALEEDETKRFPPGYVRLTRKRLHDYSGRQIGVSDNVMGLSTRKAIECGHQIIAGTIPVPINKSI